ncbi:hypothetical protein BC830DRAFT_1043611, partial [Chytriomyces sp. MP71]
LTSIPQVYTSQLPKPDTPHLQVHLGTGPYSARLVTLKPFKAGQVLAATPNLAPAPTKRYTTVQVGKDAHAELNSDLVYMNHSCDPSAVLDVRHRVVVARRDMAHGEGVTFFYPSTEWEMAQPFECWCGSPNCLKVVRGAKYMDKATLDKFAVSEHILELAAERDSSDATASAD